MNKNNKDNMEIKIMEAFTSMKSDQEIGMPDIEDELSKLMIRRNRQTMMNHWRKIAASVATIVTVCCIAVAAIINHRTMVSDENKADITENTFTTKARNTQAIPVDTTLAMPRLVALDNAELCEIMDSLNNIYKVEVVFNNEEVKHLHLHFKFCTGDKLSEVIQNLNMFEKINIKQTDGKLEVE